MGSEKRGVCTSSLRVHSIPSCTAVLLLAHRMTERPGARCALGDLNCWHPPCRANALSVHITSCAGRCCARIAGRSPVSRPLTPVRRMRNRRGANRHGSASAEFSVHWKSSGRRRCAPDRPRRMTPSARDTRSQAVRRPAHTSNDSRARARPHRARAPLPRAHTYAAAKLGAPPRRARHARRAAFEATSRPATHAMLPSTPRLAPGAGRARAGASAATLRLLAAAALLAAIPRAARAGRVGSGTYYSAVGAPFGGCGVRARRPSPFPHR